jgi:DMSO/TMAO reductase YedYZ molybdopterin-dependent catalytic subunit
MTDVTTTSADTDAGTLPRPALGVAGLLSAAGALGAAELLSGLSSRIPSLLIEVGDWVIDNAPDPMVDFGKETFGTNDKPALIIGTTIICLAVGWVLGIVGAARRWTLRAGFALFALFGGLVASTDPFTSTSAAWFAALTAGLVGVLFYELLLRATPLVRGDATVGDGPDRRTFLSAAGAAAALTVAGAWLGRYLRGRHNVEAARRDVAAQLGTEAPGSAIAASVAGTLDAEVPGITPYLVPNDDFYRIDTALLVPQVDPVGWRLRIHGMVDREVELTFDDLAAMEQIEEIITIQCVSNEVGGDLVGNARWSGPRLDKVLELAGVQEGATQLVGRSVDGWTGGFPTAIALDGRPAMIALTMNGEPLPTEHGFPARLIVPGLYGYVSATKWLSDLELTTWEAFDGYWIPRGWAKEGPIKPQSRIDVPGNRDRVAAGLTAVAGVAWSPTREVAAVEVQVDDGPWSRARLAETPTELAWVQWVYEWDATPGEHELRVRVTTGDGEVQTAEEAPPAPDGATGHHTIRVDVR